MKGRNATELKHEILPILVHPQPPVSRSVSARLSVSRASLLLIPDFPVQRQKIGYAIHRRLAFALAVESALKAGDAAGEQRERETRVISGWECEYCSISRDVRPKHESGTSTGNTTTAAAGKRGLT